MFSYEHAEQLTKRWLERLVHVTGCGENTSGVIFSAITLCMVFNLKCLRNNSFLNTAMSVNL